jgi:hypothetical protein
MTEPVQGHSMIQVNYGRETGLTLYFTLFYFLSLSFLSG